MGKVFTYTRVTESGYLEGSDENEEWGEDFEYEVEWANIRKALGEFIYSDYFTKVKGAKEDKEVKEEIIASIVQFIWDNDLEDTLSENYEEELKEYFSEDAFDSL